MAQGLRGVLLVEDDEGDAVLVQECLREAGVTDADVVWRRTVRDGIAALGVVEPSCVLLDLGLPDAQGLDALHSVVAAGGNVPVIVLTGRHDRIGTEAVSAGAQDYLVKDDLTPDLLDRTIRYAVERRQTQVTELQLREERLLAAENSRLERGLLPRPLLHTDAVHCASLYRPGRARAVLGGDFFDVVETDDGRIRAVIGDVMGHGPDEAALGVHLRVAWRALVLADVPDGEILGTLSRLLEAERTGEVFVTLCDSTLDRDLGLSVRVAGHPPPLICQHGAARYAEVVVEPPLGIRDHLDGREWPLVRTQLAPGAAVMLYTDGLLDAFRVVSDPGSIGLEELQAEVDAGLRAGQPAAEMVGRLVGAVPDQAADEDDTALVVLTVRGRPA